MRRSLIVLIITCVVPVAARGADARDEVKLNADEQKILELTNQARQKEKLPPLTLSPLLCQVARAHSANMARQEKMEHVLDGKTPAQRVQAAGYRFRIVGENVAYGLRASIDEVFDGWMKSQGHRENILRDTYREIGIGMATNAKGEAYYTQVFGTILGGR